MIMTVMQIGIVRMPMHQRRVAMPVGVRLARRCIRPVLVLMMFIMVVPMLMLQHVMGMLVLVPLGQMQP